MDHPIYTIYSKIKCHTIIRDMLEGQKWWFLTIIQEEIVISFLESKWKYSCEHFQYLIAIRFPSNYCIANLFLSNGLFCPPNSMS